MTKQRNLSKFFQITGIFFALFFAILVIIKYKNGGFTATPSAEKLSVSGTAVQVTDVFVNDSGTNGYIHGVWGLGSNYNDPNRHEPHCGVILKELHYPQLRKIIFGKLAEETVWESDVDGPENYGNPFAGCPNLEEVQVEEGNPHLVAENGMLSYRKGTLIACLPKKEGDVSISDNIHTIGIGAMNGCIRIRSLSLPKTVERIREGALGDMKRCKEYKVSPENTKFCTVDGVIYTKDKKELVAYPAGKDNLEYHILQGVEKICAGAFMGTEHLKEVYLPDTLKIIETEAFRDCTSLEEVHAQQKLTNTGTDVWKGCKKRLKHPKTLG